MTKGELAEQYFKQGYNCSQAVVLAFAPEMGIDEKTLLSLASSFGGGFGRSREVCGAVSGMTMISGMKFGYYSPDDSDSKAKNYEQVRILRDEFKKVNGSIVCRELLGLDKKEESSVPSPRTQQYYQKRPCSKIVHTAADIIEKNLFSK